MLSDRQADAVAATIAIHRLEGWEPSDEQAEALEALAGGYVRFADYLAAFLDRHPPAPPHRRRRRLRRPVPYVIPGTDVLRNTFGATSDHALRDLEFTATAGRMVMRLREHTNDDALDVRAIHRHLFADVYTWAGAYRTTELRRGEHGFAWQSSIARRMTTVHHWVRDVVASCADHDVARLAYELARIYAAYNQIHPFREGNGRAGALLLHTVAERCGQRLDLTGITRHEWYAAAADSMPLRRDGHASHRPFLYLLRPAVIGTGR